MCVRCDRPNLTTEAYGEQILQLVAQNRFAVQRVSGSRETAELAYTVGLTSHGLPELVITGLQAQKASRLLNHWADYLLDVSLVLPGETLEVRGSFFEAIEVAAPEDHLFVAVQLYGEVVRGLQLAWSDDRGRPPWHPGHRARRAGQPLLGERADLFCGEHRLDVLADLG